MKITVLGAGTWGVALAATLVVAGHEVRVWSISQDEVDELSTKRSHPKLKGLVIPETITFTNDMNCAADAEALLFSVPSVFLRSTAEKARPYVTDGQLLITATKGIEAGTLYTMSSVLHDVFPGNRVVAISGPTHAEEVAVGLPTTIVCACENYETARITRKLFSGTAIQAYTNPDIIGVELCAALKNVIALAAGVATGLGYGDNAKAAIITRGLAEIKRLGVAMGCMEQTFAGLAGIGDLVVTAASSLSRNNNCGILIGKGVPVNEAIRQIGMVVEGVNAVEPALALAQRYSVRMPLTAAMNDILHGKQVSEAANQLLNRHTTTEMDQKDLDIIYENEIIRNRREFGMKRVITYGTFDLLHYGHINLLRRAKALGDYLIVVLSSDEFNWNEKHKKTYFSYEQRKQLLEAVRYVDLVIPEENWEQKRSDMHEYHIDTFVMGDDWNGKFDFLKEEGVNVVYLPRTPEISTSQIKKDLYDANAESGDSMLSHDDLVVDTGKQK